MTHNTLWRFLGSGIATTPAAGAYVETGLGKSGQFREQAASDAKQYGWRFEQLRGDPELVRKLLAAEWDDDFLVLQPGQRIAVTHDSRIIEAV